VRLGQPLNDLYDLGHDLTAARPSLKPSSRRPGTATVALPPCLPPQPGGLFGIEAALEQLRHRDRACAVVISGPLVDTRNYVLRNTARENGVHPGSRSPRLALSVFVYDYP
jgi:hypothetical protein